jgi:tetratricopeptide (TPR) repeat protein
VLLPIFLLLLVEGCLRLAGYGFPTGFFLESFEDNQRVLIENPKFGWRFFPPAVARSPLPLSIPLPKPASTIRILLFGESAAMGDPDPSYGIARQLEKQLKTRHPDKRIEVFNVAMTAINSHVIREIASDCKKCQADAWLIYAGNNEIIGPFGAGTIFGKRAASLSLVRAELWLKTTKLGQLLTNLLRNKKAPAEWEGMELFLEQQVRSNDPRMHAVYRNFQQNLTSIVQLGRQAGAKVILSTVAVNLDANPPFASMHRQGLSAAELTAWDRSFNEGKNGENNARYPDALKAYEDALRIDGEHAELAYRVACCHLALKNEKEARRYFQLARDQDTLRFRADTRIIALTRECAERAQLPLVDLEQEFENGWTTSVGTNVFYDHVHFNFSGNRRAASALLAAVEKHLFDGRASATVLGEQAATEALAFTPFDQQRICEEMRARLQQPPFTYQSNAKQRDTELARKLEGLKALPGQCIAVYHSALAKDSNDWTLHANFATLLEAANEFTGASNEWQIVGRLMPHVAEPWFHLGSLAQSAGHPEEAVRWFREALNKKPDSTEALNGLGTAYSDQGDPEKALRCFKDALKINPRFYAARVNMGRQFSKRGDLAEAMREYTKVLESDANNVPARINLGKILADQGNLDRAVKLYLEAIRLKPEEPIAHFNLGNALASLDRHDEAQKHFQLAVEQLPDFVEAQYALAMELIRAGKHSEALPHLAVVVRLAPGKAEARFNYGIALAKGKNFADAVEQFREVLRLQPDHTAAQKAMDRAMQLMNR